MADNMEALAPTTLEVRFRGEAVTLRPITAGATPEIVRIARPIIDRVLDLPELPDESSGEMIGLAMDLVADHGDAAFRAVSLASGVSEQGLREGDLAEFVEITLAVIRINRDFFVHRLAPLMASLRQKRAAAITGAGNTPSTFLSGPATH